MSKVNQSELFKLLEDYANEGGESSVHESEGTPSVTKREQLTTTAGENNDMAEQEVNVGVVGIRRANGLEL